MEPLGTARYRMDFCGILSDHHAACRRLLRLFVDRTGRTAELSENARGTLFTHSTAIDGHAIYRPGPHLNRWRHLAGRIVLAPWPVFSSRGGVSFVIRVPG